MGAIGYLLKKQKWWGLLILTPVLLFLGDHLCRFTGLTVYWLPHHLLSAIFCLVTLFLYPLCIYEDARIRRIGIVISALIAVGAIGLAFLRPNVYRTDLLSDHGEIGAVFDDSYLVRLADPRYGTVAIVYNEGIESYFVEAELLHGGDTALILTDASGNETVYDLHIEYARFDIALH